MIIMTIYLYMYYVDIFSILSKWFAQFFVGMDSGMYDHDDYLYG